MDIQNLRNQIDQVDSELVRLYVERIKLVREIGRWKRENNLPILDAEREKNLLNRVGELAGEQNEDRVRALFSFILSQSRSEQRKDKQSGSAG